MTHSDVRKMWPDLFHGLDPDVESNVVATAASSLLEGIELDRDEVQHLIRHAQHLKSTRPATPRIVTA